jgi:hypothetical protein
MNGGSFDGDKETWHLWGLERWTHEILWAFHGDINEHLGMVKTRQNPWSGWASTAMLMWTRWDQGVDLRIAILSQRFVWIHMTELTCMHLECQIMHTAILISVQKAKATIFIRIASRREPPAPRELDREETSGRTWPKQSRLGSNLAVLGLKSGAHFGPT